MARTPGNSPVIYEMMWNKKELFHIDMALEIALKFLSVGGGEDQYRRHSLLKLGLAPVMVLDQDTMTDLSVAIHNLMYMTWEEQAIACYLHCWEVLERIRGSTGEDPFITFIRRNMLEDGDEHEG